MDMSRRYGRELERKEQELSELTLDLAGGDAEKAAGLARKFCRENRDVFAPGRNAEFRKAIENFKAD